MALERGVNNYAFLETTSSNQVHLSLKVVTGNYLDLAFLNEFEFNPT